MSKHDAMIRELVNALDAIRRHAVSNGQHFIVGVAEQAISNCNSQRKRNTDGYLIVKESK